MFPKPPVTEVNARAGIESVSAPGVPKRVLVMLTLLVLVIHLALLQGTAAMVVTSQTRAMPFTTRAIVLNPAIAPNPAVEDQPVAQAPAAPAKPPRTQRAATANQASKAPEVPAAYDELAINSAATEVTTAASDTVAQSPAPAPTLPASAAEAPSPPESAPIESTATIASAASAIATPYTVPGSVRLKYNVEGTKDNLNYHARAEMLWRQDGNTYEAQLSVSAFLIGSRVRTSSGRLTADGLLPMRFSDKYRSEVAAHFDRVNQKVTFSANTPEVPLLAGMQDQLSVFVQLGAMLGGAPDRYPPGTEFSFETIGPRAAETWLIVIEGEEKLSLPGGDISTIKLIRSTQREFDQRAELWLAPSLGYLPVRIKLTERNGDFVDQVWRATEAP